MDIAPEVFTWDSFILQVTIHVAPENVEAFFASFKTVYDRAVKYEQVTRFEVFEVAGQPGVVTWTEHWNAKLEWVFENWIKSELMTEYLAKTENLFLKEREMRFLKPKTL